VAAPDPDCLFCRIAAGGIPADVVHRTAGTVAFRDLNPQAPTHVLVIPLDHHGDVGALAAADPALAAELLTAVAGAAAASGVAGAGYRVVTNVGADAGQLVPHAHLHVLGGRRMGWPPG
jgi:histidine triad (HIT) family protein